MRELTVYTRLYGDCLTAALKGIGRNAWTLLLPMGLLLALQLAGSLLGGMGRAGGFVIGFVLAALGSCYLSFLGEVVAGSPVSLKELAASVKTYFWSVINVMFVYWVAQWLVRLAGGPSAGALMLALEAAAFIGFNAVPETIYQKGTYGGLATLQASFEFLRDNLVTWFLPNILLVGLGWLVLQGLDRVGGLPIPYLEPILLGALLHVAMVFRGHVYRELSRSSHRQRMFRYGER